MKIERNQYQLTGYCCADGEKWVTFGLPVSAVNLEKVQPDYHSWVKTSIEVFAEGEAADLKVLFLWKDYLQ